MAIFVAGATGFVGGQLTRLLVERGEHVRAFVRSVEDDAPVRALGADVITGNFEDPEALRSAAVGCRVAYNCVGLVSYERRDCSLLRDANVDAVRRVLAAVDPDARLVHVSSLAAVGPAPAPTMPVTEDRPFPKEVMAIPYCATKRKGEQVALEGVAQGRDVVIANPSVAFGPGDARLSSTWPVHAYLSGRLRVYIDGGSGHVDVRDVVDALVSLGEHGRTGERYILTAPDANLSWRDLFRLIGDATGVRRKMVHVPGPVAEAGARLLRWPEKPGRVHAARMFWFASAAKAEREIGFTTRPFVETIRATAGDIRR